MTGRDFTERDIHLALDGELPDDERSAYGLWLDANPEMKARAQRYAADRDALRAVFNPVMDEPVPARLRGAVLGDGKRAAPARHSRWWLAAAAAVLLAVGASGGYIAGLSGIGLEDGSEDQLAEAAIASYAVYASEQRHAVEVPASDKEHMQDWLSNRVGLKLVAPDLTPDGFQLVGGRLLPAGTGKAAMLLYEDTHGNRISVFVTSEPAGKKKGTYADSADGPRAVYWLDKGYGCAVVGTLPGERLNEVARSAYRQLIAGMSV